MIDTTPLMKALSDAAEVNRQSNQNLSSAIQAAIDTFARMDFTPPPPVLRIVRSPDELQESLDGAGVIYVPNGLYSVDAGAPVSVRSKSIVLFGQNANIGITPNGFQRYDTLCVQDAEDVQIVGGQLMGDRLVHDYTDPGTHEWGMGLRVRRSKRIYVRDMFIANFTGDGFSASGEDITFENLMCLRNRRQGGSFYAGRKYRVLGGQFSDTGNLGANLGTKPMAGIDVEPDGDNADDILIKGATFNTNQTDGVLACSNDKAMATITNMSVTDCQFFGSPNGLHLLSMVGKTVDVQAYRNTFQSHKGAGVFVEGAGCTVDVGDADPKNGNVFIAKVDRPDLEGVGLKTKYDIQKRPTTGAGPNLNVGYNFYK